MSNRPILCHPHPLLLAPVNVVRDFDDQAKAHMKRLYTDLRDTCNKSHSAALSAVQIGAPWAAVYVSGRVAGEELFLVNPIIIERGPLLQNMAETCPSLPGIELRMQRSSSVTVSARKANGDEITIPATRNLAQCLQHEINHLDGRTLIECAKPAKRRFLASQVAKFGGRDGALLTY